jgi:proton-translocating NAD(P)+ transhydrogenase subunit alpha
MIVGVPKELFPGETRVALIPDIIPMLKKRGIDVIVEKDAGFGAGHLDKVYEEKGATISASRDEVFQKADIIVQVRSFGGDEDASKDDLAKMKPGQLVCGQTDSLGNADKSKDFAEKKVNLFSMELVPRITRAQSMDVLSSQANIAGFKAVLLSAVELPKIFPMMMTAAGTIAPSKVFVIGAGVAGLSAIATAKRLGAVVHAFDVRPEVKEQIESLGGKFVEVELDTSEAKGEGGYAKEQSEEFLKKQREMMAKVVAESDVVITTAAIPGRKSPVIVTADMVKNMHPGSVIVDLASERGGNCELTEHAKEIVVHDVKIIGPANIVSTVATHASQMYSKNVQTLLFHLIDKEGNFNLDMEDEITAGSMVVMNGEVVHPRVRDILGMPALAAPAKPNDAKEA